jgi:hypothetical protein
VEPKPAEKKPETPVVKILPKKKEGPIIGITRGTAREEYKVGPEGTVLQPNSKYEPPAKRDAEVPPPAPAVPSEVPPAVGAAGAAATI